MKLEGIADHIDAEHERAMADAELAAAPTEAQLEEWGYVELPKDAEGVPIHIGDTIYTADRGTANVFGIYIMQHKKNVMCMFSDGRSRVYDPHELSHERPDSLGRIADDIEAAEDWCDQNGDYGTGITSVSEATLQEWADRIRKLAKKEEDQQWHIATTERSCTTTARAGPTRRTWASTTPTSGTMERKSGSRDSQERICHQ